MKTTEDSTFTVTVNSAGKIVYPDRDTFVSVNNLDGSTNNTTPDINTNPTPPLNNFFDGTPNSTENKQGLYVEGGNSNLVGNDTLLNTNDGSIIFYNNVADGDLTPTWDITPDGIRFWNGEPYAEYNKTGFFIQTGTASTLLCNKQKRTSPQSSKKYDVVCLEIQCNDINEYSNIFIEPFGITFTDKIGNSEDDDVYESVTINRQSWNDILARIAALEAMHKSIMSNKNNE